jgi:hypothetical protein
MIIWCGTIGNHMVAKKRPRGVDCDIVCRGRASRRAKGERTVAPTRICDANCCARHRMPPPPRTASHRGSLLCTLPRHNPRNYREKYSFVRDKLYIIIMQLFPKTRSNRFCNKYKWCYKFQFPFSYDNPWEFFVCFSQVCKSILTSILLGCNRKYSILIELAARSPCEVSWELGIAWYRSKRYHISNDFAKRINKNGGKKRAVKPSQSVGIRNAPITTLSGGDAAACASPPPCYLNRATFLLNVTFARFFQALKIKGYFDFVSTNV